MNYLQEDRALVRYYGDTALIGGGAAEGICAFMDELDATRNDVQITITKDDGKPGRLADLLDAARYFLPVPTLDGKRKRAKVAGNFHVLPKAYRFPQAERGLAGDEQISEARYRGVSLGDEITHLRDMVKLSGITLEVREGMPMDRASIEEIFSGAYQRL